MIKPLLCAICLLLANAAMAYDRIVALTPDVAEVLVALGAKNAIIGKDSTNKDPALAHAKDIGVHRNLSAEPIVALKPDLVVGSHMALPSSIYQRLNGLKIKAVNVASDESVATYAVSIRTLGLYVGQAQKADELAKTWLLGMRALPKTQKRYLLSYDGRYVAGRGTVADELIRRAGGINAADNVQGFKPLSREGWQASQADIIIIAKHHQATLGSADRLKNRAEFKTLPAAKNNQIYYWAANDFLRYGLDSPQVVQKLNALAK